MLHSTAFIGFVFMNEWLSNYVWRCTIRNFLDTDHPISPTDVAWLCGQDVGLRLADFSWSTVDMWHITHTRTVVRECFKIRPLATPKPLNRSSQKLAGVITSWTAPGTQNFVAIDSGVSVPQIRDFAVILGWLVFCSFFGFFNKATAYTPGRIFTQNTSNDVVPDKEVPTGGSKWLYFIFGPLNFRKTAISGTDFDWTVFLRPKPL